MTAAREALWESHGAQVNYLLINERFEYQSNGGDALGVWEPEPDPIPLAEITMLQLETPYLKRFWRYLSGPAPAATP